MMSRFIAVLLALMAWFAGEAAARPGLDAVRLERGGCERRCAVYSLTVTGDGRAVYRGRFYVRKAGPVVMHLGPAATRAIFNQVAALDPAALKPAYRRDAGDCDAWQDDRPTSTLTFEWAGASRAVTYNLGCVGPVTSRLADLESALNRAATVDRLVK